MKRAIAIACAIVISVSTAYTIYDGWWKGPIIFAAGIAVHYLYTNCGTLQQEGHNNKMDDHYLHNSRSIVKALINIPDPTNKKLVYVKHEQYQGEGIYKVYIDNLGIPFMELDAQGKSLVVDYNAVPPHVAVRNKGISSQANSATSIKSRIQCIGKNEWMSSSGSVTTVIYGIMGTQRQ